MFGRYRFSRKKYVKIYKGLRKRGDFNKRFNKTDIGRILAVKAFESPESRTIQERKIRIIMDRKGAIGDIGNADGKDNPDLKDNKKAGGVLDS